MSLFNNTKRYGIIAMTLHWLMAIGIVTMILLAELGGHDHHSSAIVLSLPIVLHISLGLVLLALIIIRLAYRRADPPPPPVHAPLWQLKAALWVHRLLYLVMVLYPLSGWAMISTATPTVTARFFGMVSVPLLPLPSLMNDFFTIVHFRMKFALIILVVLHIAAALYHHFRRKDDVLRRMMPQKRQK